MSKTKKMASVAIMLALLMVGTMGIAALAAKSYTSISIYYNEKYGSYVTMNGTVTITVENFASSTGTAYGVLQNSAGHAMWGNVSAGIGRTVSDTESVSNESCRIALFGYYKANANARAVN